MKYKTLKLWNVYGDTTVKVVSIPSEIKAIVPILPIAFDFIQEEEPDTLLISISHNNRRHGEQIPLPGHFWLGDIKPNDIYLSIDKTDKSLLILYDCKENREVKPEAAL